MDTEKVRVAGKRDESPYVLMTAAYNEEAHIGKTLRSVIAQTRRPERWVIVSDNSGDRTDEIIRAYADRHDFIRFLRVTKDAGHSFQSKVVALHKGISLLDGADYEFIGNIDADLVIDPHYFERLLNHFHQDPKLGLAGGFVYEDYGDGFKSRWSNNTSDVGHAAHLVRRTCYQAIGGYTVLKYGGEDWYAQTSARMKGWRVEAMPELKIYHHRHTGGGNHPVKSAFRQGRMDYSFGSDPSFEVAKCLRRLREKPYVIAAMSRLAGFVWPFLFREAREVSEEFKTYLREQQRSRISSLVGLNKALATEQRSKRA